MIRSTLVIALLAASSLANAAPWIYRGTLNDGGKPANGHYDLRLTLVNSTGTAQISQPVTLNRVAVKDGNFTAEVDFGFDLSNAPAMRLKTEVQQNGSGFASLGEPSAFDANAALAGICWDTTGNVVAAGEFLGSTNNVPVEIRANNQRAARFEVTGSANQTRVTLGSSANFNVGSGATISGGGSSAMTCGAGTSSCVNLTDELFATISGGAGNTIVGSWGVIGGGNSNSTSGIYATIGGGGRNNISNGGSYATIAGGEGNAAQSTYSVVGGGALNIASGDEATVSGGLGNIASGDSAVVSGGSENTASGFKGVVGGGQVNTASGNEAAVGGGSLNTASGRYATVSGGYGNCAGGYYSWTGGIQAKVRPGSSSGAPGGGCTGIANSGDADGDNGTFVWADDQAAAFTSTGPRQFLVRAQGGMAINTNTPTVGAALTVTGGNVSIPAAALDFGATTRQMINLWGGPTAYGIGVQDGRQYFRVPNTGGFNWFVGGVHSNTNDNPGAGGTWRMHLGSVGNLLTSTGTIGTLSDARLKDRVIDYTNALDRINALRPVNYHYIEGGRAAFQPEGTQVGFIAQELQKVFPDWVLQGDDGYLQLSMRGFEAVAVRAIQELSAENADLRARLAAIEARLDRQ